MKGCLVLFLIVAGLAVGALATLRGGYGGTVLTMAQNLMGGQSSGYLPQQFEADLVDQVNYARIAAKRPVAKVDEELQAWLHSQVASLDCDDLMVVQKKIQLNHPRYLNLWVYFSGSARMETLGGEFTPFVPRIAPECNAIAVMVRKKPAHLGYEALLVTGNRIDDFTPEALSAHETEYFFSACLHCGHQHICRIAAVQRGIGMQCPECGKTYGVLAADSQGRFRYVNEFLTGYQPPASYDANSEKLDEMYTIWRAVVANCSYVKDSLDAQNKRDCWQTGLETQCRRFGDCEDSSIFLADWLIARGFQARVVMGHYGDIGEHAWCVVRLDNVDYLLESTEGPPDPQNPPYVSDIGSRYVPETMFDRQAIYVRSHPKEPFGLSDYWSQRVWTSIRPRTMFQGKLSLGLAAQKPDTAGTGLALANSPGVNISLKASANNQHQVGLNCFPFPKLMEVPAKAQDWEVLLHDAPLLNGQ